MSEFPETRESLLARVKDPLDREAWIHFSAVYRPVVYRLARARGLQDADAQDLAQQVLAAVANAIERWEPDPERGRFRSWLSQIVRNAATNALTRVRPDTATGGTDVVSRLAQHPERDPEATEDFENEYRRAVFRWAQDRIREEFQESTWSAFQRTAVYGQSVPQVADDLGISVGAVYAARSRVMRRLKEMVRQYDDE
jgi:RNA polymerase sigma factor (sigma-70 family)